MATRNISTKLAIDGESQYREALKSINAEMRQMQANMKLTESAFAGNANSMEALRAKGAALAEAHRVQIEKIRALQDALNNAKAAEESYANNGKRLEAQIAANRAKMEELKKSTGDTSAEEARLAAETERLEKELDTNNRYLDAASKGVTNWQLSLTKAQTDLNKLDAEIAANDKAMADAARGAEDLGRQYNQAGHDANSMASSIGELDALLAGAGIVAMLHKVADAFGACVEQAIAFESAMAGVKRTVGGDDEFIAGLGEAFKDLSTEIPATAEELAGIATTAGQLGIHAENVEAFTTVMAKLATTTDLTADTAATMLAQFSNITGVTDYERLGSVVANLGDATATTASKVVEMSQGMAAAANIAGLSATDTLAIAAAVGSLGIEAQAGSTAMQTLISTLFKATETGGDKLTAFASVANMTAEQFKEKWQTDAVGALDAFIQGLNDTERNGKSAIVLLDELGITNVRQTKAILGLASAGDLLSNTVAQANNAWAENTSLAEKASVMYGTTEAKVTMMKNAFANTKDAIGSQLTPALGRLAETITPALQKVTEFTEKHEKLVPTVLAVVSALGSFIGVIGAVAAAIKLASVAASVFALATASISAPLLLGVAAVAALGTGVAVMAGVMRDEGVKEANDLRTAVEECVESFENAKGTFEDTQETVGVTAEKGLELVGRLKDLEDQGVKTAEQQAEYASIIAQLQGLFPNLNFQVDENTGLLVEGAEALERQIQDWKDLAIAQAQQQLLAQYASALVEATNEQHKAEQAVSDELLHQQELVQQYRDLQNEAAKIIEDRAKLNSDETLTWKERRDLAKELNDRQIENTQKIQETERQLAESRDRQHELNDALGEAKTKLGECQSEFDEAAKAIGEMSANAAEAVGDMADAGAEAGTNFTQGVAEGVSSGSDAVAGAAGEAANAGTEAAKAAWQEHSPSKVGEEIGRNFPAGIAQGIRSGTPLITAALTAGFNQIKSQTKAAGEECSKGFKAGFEKITSQTQSTLSSLRSTIRSGTSGMYSEMYSVGSNVVAGMIAGMNGHSSSLYATIRRIVTHSIAVAQAAAAVQSPSKKTEWIYANVIEGGIVGIEKNADRLHRAMQKATDMSLDVSVDTRKLEGLEVEFDSAIHSGVEQSAQVLSLDTEPLGERFDRMENTFGRVIDAIRQWKVVLDTGETVGALADPLDEELGYRAMIEQGRSFA